MRRAPQRSNLGILGCSAIAAAISPDSTLTHPQWCSSQFTRFFYCSFLQHLTVRITRRQAFRHSSLRISTPWTRGRARRRLPLSTDLAPVLPDVSSASVQREASQCAAVGRESPLPRALRAAAANRQTARLRATWDGDGRCCVPGSFVCSIFNRAVCRFAAALAHGEG